jgi:gamma-D-glutamyl-L-lysine dipeptidyl-peptidase
MRGINVLAPIAITLAPVMTAGCGGSVSAGIAAGTSPGGIAAASAPARCTSGTCWVAVSVTTLWIDPSYPRPRVDRPALTNPAHPQAWVSSMTFAQKLWLYNGRPGGTVNTQALYGTKVKVLGHRVMGDGTRWAKIAVPSQATPKNRQGYPGWVPDRQLTGTAPTPATTTAVISSRTARVWSAWTNTGVAGHEVIKLSYGTRLPAVRIAPAYVTVKLIGGRQVALPRSTVKLHAAGTSWGATRAKIVADARQFRGLDYLWAGTSGFGYDCSGFTYSVYRNFGITLPRDADRQYAHGKPVPPGSLRPADLVFYRSSPGGPVGHVGMYIGNGKIIDAPRTGQPVKIEQLSSHSNYAGARRYL